MLASTASESPVKTESESHKVPLISLNVQQQRTGRLVRPVSEQPPGFFTQHTDTFVDDDDMDSDTVRIRLFDKITIILEQGE